MGEKSGALLGALLGDLLWTIVEVLGFVSEWIGILIVVFAYLGYVYMLIAGVLGLVSKVGKKNKE